VNELIRAAPTVEIPVVVQLVEPQAVQPVARLVVQLVEPQVAQPAELRAVQQVARLVVQPAEPRAAQLAVRLESGTWFGATNFGDAVVVIDSANTLYGLSSSGGSYEAVHGTVGGSLQRFLHRNSDNAAHGDSFTLVGDAPNPADANAAENFASYNLSVANDGQQLNNAGGSGNFSLTFATENDIAPIDASFLAGSWRALTSFCPSGCDLSMSMNFSGNTVSGDTIFEGGTPIGLNGQIAAAADSSLYMTVSFSWNGQTRAGILHRDRINSSRVILNTVGDDAGTNKTFSAILTKQ